MSLPKETMEILEAIAPELKESRDERIRKCIGMALTDVDEQRFIDYGITLKDCLAWLEKQDHDGKKWLTPAELNRLMTLRYEAGFDDGVRSEMEKQKEQKPAEWSEEDEKQIRQIERIVKDAGCSVQLQERIHNWFNSLRPSWKPSEEQMGALSWMLENARGNIDFDPLKDLYKQLKKLM